MIYEFKCPKCHQTIEVEKKLDDNTSPFCCEESCQVEMVKIISASSFHLKGGGWYKDGYSKG